LTLASWQKTVQLPAKLPGFMLARILLNRLLGS